MSVQIVKTTGTVEPRRATKLERQRRINDIYKLFLGGGDHNDVLKYAEIKGWGVSLKTIWGMETAAYKILNTRLEEDRHKIQAAEERRLFDLYKRSMKINDYKTCLAVLKEYHNITGLHNPEMTAQFIAVSGIDLLRQKIDAAILADPTARDRLLAAIPPGADEMEQTEDAEVLDNVKVSDSD